MKVNRHQFESEVIQSSHHQPVLVNLWDPRQVDSERLAFSLDRLEAEFAGRFKLIDIDVASNPEVAQAFGTDVFPHAVLFHEGRPVAGFSGNHPIEVVRQFLAQHVDDPFSRLARRFMEARTEKRHAEAESTGRVLLALNPAAHAVRIALSQTLLSAGRPEEAARVFDPLRPSVAAARRAQPRRHKEGSAAPAADWMPAATALEQWLDASLSAIRQRSSADDGPTGASVTATGPRDAGANAAAAGPGDAGARVGPDDAGASVGPDDAGTSAAAVGPDDASARELAGLGDATAREPTTPDERLRAGDVAFSAGRWADAFDHYLCVVKADRQFGEDAGRRRMVALFEICPDPAITAAYRRKLGAVLS